MNADKRDLREETEVVDFAIKSVKEHADTVQKNRFCHEWQKRFFALYNV